MLVYSGSSFYGTFHSGEGDDMQQSDDSMIEVPRKMAYGWMCAMGPCAMLALNMIDNPRLHGVRGVDILRLVTIGFGAGIFFCGLLLFFMSKSDARTSTSSDLDQTKRPSSTI
jgi:hypothetical protein